MNTQEFKFAVGDAVRLQTEEIPLMEVETTAVDHAGKVYVCAWFDRNQQYKTRWFRENQLKAE